MIQVKLAIFFNDGFRMKDSHDTEMLGHVLWINCFHLLR